jgi:outer membrane biosynthesis protein TonB
MRFLYASLIIKSDNEIFNQPSLDAAMKFEFIPAAKNNKAVSMWVVVPFKFKLDK